MSKTVKAFVIDENTRQELVNLPKIDYVLSDAVEVLVAQGLLATDDDGIFFQRQLEYIQAQSFDVLYPDLMAREVFDLNTEGGEGINTITYRSYDKRGETAIIAGKATDLPRGDISGEEYTINVRTLGNAFGYSRQEIAAAKLVGMPLEARKAEATRRSYEEKVNQVTWFGSAESKLQGLFGGPASDPWSTATRTVLAGSAVDGKTQWYVGKSGDVASTKTPDEIIADLTSACAQMYSDTKKLFRPNCIIMPVQAKQFIMNTPRSLQSDVSILDWFVANNMFITSKDQIKDVNELQGIYPATTGAAFDPTAALFDGFTILATAPDNMRIREPFPYIHLPVQYKGLEFEINCYGRFAGLEMIRPAAVQHFHGVTAA